MCPWTLLSWSKNPEVTTAEAKEEFCDDEVIESVSSNDVGIMNDVAGSALEEKPVADTKPAHWTGCLQEYLKVSGIPKDRYFTSIDLDNTNVGTHNNR